MSTERTRHRDLFLKMWEFRSKGNFCDIEICIQDRTFSAHKVVIASCSEYFQAMFLCGLAERKQCSVSLQGIDPDIFDMLLQFSYGEEIILTSDNVEDILTVADMLQFKDIVKLCADYLKSQLDMSNCIGIYCFAKQHALRDLKKAVWKFILSNFSDAWEQDEFLQLPYDDLLEMVKSEHIAVDGEKDVLQSILRWVQHDLKVRRRNFVSLLEHVRINLIPFQEIMEVASSIPDFCLRMAANILIRDLEFKDSNISFKEKSICSKHWEPRQSARKGFYAIGGCVPNHSRRYHWENNDLDSVSFIERFDSFTAKWDTFPISLREARTNLAAVAVNEKIYAIGGEKDSMIYGSIECFNTLQNQWDWDVPSLMVPRCSCQAVSAGGDIYVLGGCVGSGVGKSIERLNVESGQCELVSFTMQTERHSFGAVCLDNVIYMAGGVGLSECELKTVECYDLERHVWWFANDMHYRRASFGLVVLEGHIYAIGGHNASQGTMKSIEVFDPFKNTWKICASMNQARAGSFVAVMNNKILVVGGKCKTQLNAYESTWTVLNTAELYDPESNSWSDYDEMNFDARCDGTALVV